MIYPMSSSDRNDRPMNNGSGATAAELAGKRILLVDDDAELMEIIRAYLEDQGLRVTEAASARQALALARHAGPYDLVLLDIGLPDSSGLDVLEALRNDGYAAPVVMATAESSALKVWRARQLGASAYLTKPFDFDKLMQVITRVVAA